MLTNMSFGVILMHQYHKEKENSSAGFQLKC
nr:MAG TPA: hypothetical protein [Caudoviricetes sp.]